MKMLFFGTKTYDREFFDKGLKEERYKILISIILSRT